MELISGDREYLLTDDHRGVLDTIDSLRSKGISQYVDLPQIVVCGDQSSGKSSVLEAISGLSFPTKDALCTRFATELVLRRSANTTSKFSIIPGPDRTEKEKQFLSSFSHTSSDVDLGSVVEKAQELMGLNGSSKVFSRDILRVEISSPTQPHLTLVDLPGLFLAGNKDQSIEDSKIVESLVLAYMEQPRSIILAVVSAKSEFALQQVTQRAREMDPDGRRTLGLITKPDTLDEGSESQSAYLQLAHNRDVVLRHGWHVVRNRDFKARKSSKAERDAVEKEFFSRGVWMSLNPTHLGNDALVARLSKLLYDHTLVQLPQVLSEVESGISGCNGILSKLGAARGSIQDQRRYLLQLSQAFSGLVNSAVEGDYSDRAFFGNSQEEAQYETRLRAQVQNKLTDFAQELGKKGHATTIVDHAKEAPQKSFPKRVNRSDYLAKVGDMMKRNRGRELPGTFNPLVVGELFAAQCQPWKGLAGKTIKDILKMAEDFLERAMGHVADDVSGERLLRSVIKPSMARLAVSVRTKLDELLAPHIDGHPITYNHYLTENVQKVQTSRHQKRLNEALSPYMNMNANTYNNCGLDTKALFERVMAATEPNMENFAATTAVDTMEAYYKVAMKKFIDDVGVLAVEQCVVAKLPSMFTTNTVCDMSDEEINELAGENLEIVTLRQVTSGKLKVLEEGKNKLGRLGRLGKGGGL